VHLCAGGCLLGHFEKSLKLGVRDDVVLVYELAQGLSMNVNMSKLLLMMNPD
jgi:hypothetical protein